MYCVRLDEVRLRSDNMNSSLLRAKENRNDEFYTLINDIENEFELYTDHFKNKTVYCNCDNPEESNFVVYFMENFHRLGLKRFIATHYVQRTLFDYMDGNVSSTPKYLDYDGSEVIFDHMKSDGDFRSRESVEFLKDADIVVTNPPFSLFRDFIAQLVEYDKQYLVVGNMNAITYRDIFPLIKEEKMWLGNKTAHWRFRTPEGKIESVGPIVWFTNLTYEYGDKGLDLTAEYDPEVYPKFDNYDAINVDRLEDIPKDYQGIMGVPVSYMIYHTPKQFDLLGSRRWAKSKELLDAYTGDVRPKEREKAIYIDGNEIHSRLFIRKVSDRPQERKPDRQFDILGMTEDCGAGMSYGLRDGDAHPYIDGTRQYTRIFIKRP